MELGKIILHFIWGFFIGIIFYTIIFKNVHFSQQIRYFILLFTCLTCGLVTYISIQIRCISVLTLPTFCGNSGKNIVRAWILINLLQGPINNIAKNANEIVELTTCSVMLSYNLTKSRIDLMLQPFLQASLRLKPNISEISDTLRYIDKMVQPLTEEIGGSNDDKIKNKSNIKKKNNKSILFATKEKMHEKSYAKKLEDRCNVQLIKSKQKCEKTFRNLQNICQFSIPYFLGYAFCWTFRLDKICNMSKALGIKRICDPSMQVDSNIDEEHAKLLKDIRLLHTNLINPNITYMKQYVDPKLYIDDMKNASIIMVNKITEKKNIFKYIIVIICNISSLLILKILLDSQKYHNNYLKDVSFDNCCITKYFLEIDARRKIKQKFSILSLENIQVKDVINTDNMTIRKFEYSLLLKLMLKLSLEIIMVSILILIDKLFYEAMQVIRIHGNVEYSQRGSHIMSVKVKGTGMMSRLVKSMIKEFDLKNIYSALKSNTECLPKTYSLDNNFLYQIYAGYLMILLISVVQVYITRFYSSICGYFYPEQEKLRSIYFYNEILRKEYKIKKNIKKRVLRLAYENSWCRPLKYPKYLRWLKNFELTYCSICKKSEISHFRIKSSIMQMCPSAMCNIVYCLYCWKAVGEVCHACELYEMMEAQNSTDSSVEVFDN